MVLTPQKAKAMTVAMLKEELEKRGLPTDGKKVSCSACVGRVLRTRLVQLLGPRRAQTLLCGFGPQGPSPSARLRAWQSAMVGATVG